MKNLVVRLALVCSLPLVAQQPQLANVEAVPLDATRLINLTRLGWYQLEGDWSFEEVDGALVAYADGETDHTLILAAADGEILQRFRVPAGFAVRERAERLMIIDRLTTVPVRPAQTIDNAGGGKMSGCWSPLAEGYFLCEGSVDKCVYEYTTTNDGGEEVCVRLEDKCGNGGYIFINSETGEVETNIEASKCTNEVSTEIGIPDRYQ